MMLMLPHLMKGSSSEENPMSGLMMITLMKKISSSSSSDDYDYDYSYTDSTDDYDYDYDYTDLGATDDYDYDYIYDDDSSSSQPSPLAGIIQQMLRAKMMAASQAAGQTPIKVTLTPMEAGPVAISAKPTNIEIALPASRASQDKARPSDQISYRSAP